MSLLVLNSSSLIAQAFIRTLHQSQSFERIICADLYPRYSSIKSFLDFKHTLTPNKTLITDAKFTDKQDLQDITQQADHLLFVTHDYYSLAPHKIDLLTNTLSLLPIKSYKKLMYVAPVELDHALEVDSCTKWRDAETKARTQHPNLIGLRSDVTFGSNSTIANRLIQRIQFDQSICFNPQGNSPSPINTLDLQTIVARLMTDNKFNGKSYLVQGPNQVDWKKYISLLERSDSKAKFNDSLLEKLIAPTSNNVLSELIYHPSYRNLTQLINRYQSLDSQHYENASTLLEGGYSEILQYDQALFQPIDLVEKLIY